MKDKAINNSKKKLLSFELSDRITEVEKDINSKKDLYAGIDSKDLAELLGVPLDAINGSGDGEWTEWAQYGYVFIEPFKKILKSYCIDEILELLEIEITEERYEFLQNKCSEHSKREVINILTDDEKNLISLHIALKDLYDEGGDGYSCMATYSIENSDLSFEASLNGDYHTINNLKTPYHLRDEVEFSTIWLDVDNRAYFEQHFMNKEISVNEVWIEAQNEDVSNYLEYLHWIKEHIKGKPALIIYRFFNDE